jgi:hypothetical protein
MIYRRGVQFPTTSKYCVLDNETIYSLVRTSRTVQANMVQVMRLEGLETSVQSMVASAAIKEKQEFELRHAGWTTKFKTWANSQRFRHSAVGRSAKRRSREFQEWRKLGM